jgi:uncharacterized protein YbaP (TraB family)
MSRSTVDGNFEPPPDPLNYQRLAHMAANPDVFGRSDALVVEKWMQAFRCTENIHEKGGFDKPSYAEKRPWCMFNVLMLKWDSHRYYRAAIGRIHVDAFLAHRATKEVIELE